MAASRKQNNVISIREYTSNKTKINLTYTEWSRKFGTFFTPYNFINLPFSKPISLSEAGFF